MQTATGHRAQKDVSLFESDASFNVWVLFPTPGDSPVPAGRPTVQLSSDTFYLERASDPAG